MRPGGERNAGEPFVKFATRCFGRHSDSVSRSGVCWHARDAGHRHVRNKLFLQSLHSTKTTGRGGAGPRLCACDVDASVLHVTSLACVISGGMAGRNMESGRLVLGGASATRQNAPDPVLLKVMITFRPRNSHLPKARPALSHYTPLERVLVGP